MANPYVNKVEYGGQTLIDLTQDDVTAADVRVGVTFHLPSGQRTVGTASSSYEIEVEESSRTGDAEVGVAETAVANYTPSGDITTPTLDYEYRNGKLYIYGIKAPQFIGAGTKLIVKESEE